jgi:hypothetical protein
MFALLISGLALLAGPARGSMATAELPGLNHSVPSNRPAGDPCSARNHHPFATDLRRGAPYPVTAGLVIGPGGAVAAQWR